MFLNSCTTVMHMYAITLLKYRSFMKLYSDSYDVNLNINTQFFGIEVRKIYFLGYVNFYCKNGVVLDSEQCLRHQIKEKMLISIVSCKKSFPFISFWLASIGFVLAAIA